MSSTKTTSNTYRRVVNLPTRLLCFRKFTSDRQLERSGNSREFEKRNLVSCKTLLTLLTVCFFVSSVFVKDSGAMLGEVFECDNTFYLCGDIATEDRDSCDQDNKEHNSECKRNYWDPIRTAKTRTKIHELYTQYYECRLENECGDQFEEDMEECMATLRRCVEASN